MIVGAVIAIILVVVVAGFRFRTAYVWGRFNRSKGRQWWNGPTRQERRDHILGTPWVAEPDDRGPQESA